MAPPLDSLSRASCSHGARGWHAGSTPRAPKPSSSPLITALLSSSCKLQPPSISFCRRSPASRLGTTRSPASRLGTTRSPRSIPASVAQRATVTCALQRPAPASAVPPRSRSGADLLTSLLIAIAIPVVSGTLASFFNTANVDWYKSLRKPSWNPPSWVFGAAWGILYAVMGFASWLVWMLGGWEAQGYALSIYGLQLVLNLAWPALFFGAKNMSLALVDIVALWAAVLACIRAFQPVSPLAARLLYPYLAWVTYATALNYRLRELNTP